MYNRTFDNFTESLRELQPCNATFDLCNITNVTESNFTSAYDDDYYYYFYYYLPTPTVTTIVLSIFSVILFIGIVGNILVLIIIGAVKSMHTTVNICLFSLAIADLLVLVILPVGPIAVEIFDFTVPLNEDFCNFLNFYDRGALVCSTFIFFYVTIDRYFALCYPLKSRRLWTGRKTYAILVFIWIVSLSLSYPFLHYSIYEVETYDEITYYYCYTDLSEVWMFRYDTFFASFIFFLLIPVFAVFYGKMIYHIKKSVPKSSNDTQGNNVAGQRGRAQVVIMLLAVIVIFILSYLPWSFLFLFEMFFPSVFDRRELFDMKIFIINWSCRIPLYINSAANPALYFMLSSNFRQGFVTVFCRCRKTISNQASVTRNTSLSASTSQP